MPWTADQWQAFAALLRRGWPGDFAAEDANAYRVLLDDIDPADAVAALRRLLHSGHRFRPSAAEILGAVNTDAGRPTFTEAYRLIFGRGGVLKARPAPGRYGSEHARQDAIDTAALERAATMHPLVSSFVARYGVGRLRNLSVDDPDWGNKTRRDLEREWDTHAARSSERQAAQLAAPNRRGLDRLDPLAALDLKPAGELPAGATGEELPDVA